MTRKNTPKGKRATSASKGRKARGQVRLLPSGSYQARIRIDGRSHQSTKASEDAAWDFIHALLEASEEATDRVLTLDDWGHQWLDQRELDRATKYAAEERGSWSRYISRDPIGQRPLHLLRRRDVAEWGQRMVGRGLKRESVVKSLGQLKRGLRAAHDRGMVESNVAETFRLPTYARADAKPEDAAWTWLTEEEIEAVLGLEHYRPRLTASRRALFAVAIYAGLRLSELRHLRWENVKLDGPRPHLQVRAPLKTPAARRDVALLPPALAHLRRWRNFGGAVKATGHVWTPGEGDGMYGPKWDANWSDTPYNVTLASGEVVMRRKRGAKTRAGIERRARFHDLRHTCASHLVQGTWTAELSLVDVKDWMGHSAITVTQRYAHASSKRIADKVAIFHGRDTSGGD